MHNRTRSGGDVRAEEMGKRHGQHALVVAQVNTGNGGRRSCAEGQWRVIIYFVMGLQ